MEYPQPVAIRLWQARRALQRWSPLALVCVVLVLGTAVSVQRLGSRQDTISSSCMPYLLRLPGSWTMTRQPRHDCGAPFLFDGYQLQVAGRHLDLSVQAVSLTGDRIRGEIDFSRYGSAVQHSRSGQGYTTLVQQDATGRVDAHATFQRSGLNYVVTVTGPEPADPPSVLGVVMDGWYVTS